MSTRKQMDGTKRRRKDVNAACTERGRERKIHGVNTGKHVERSGERNGAERMAEKKESWPTDRWSRRTDRGPSRQSEKEQMYNMKKRKGKKKTNGRRETRKIPKKGDEDFITPRRANPSCGTQRAARVIHVHIEKRICKKKLTWISVNAQGVEIRSISVSEFSKMREGRGRGNRGRNS